MQPRPDKRPLLGQPVEPPARKKDQPSAFEPVQDRIEFPRTDGKILVVGCGTTPHTHPKEPHTIAGFRGGPARAISIDSPGLYTMDTRPAMHPHRVGSFWVTDHTEDLPDKSFDLIYFESLPGDPLLDNPGWCLTALKTAHRLLKDGKLVVVRTARKYMAEGQPLLPAMGTVFGKYWINEAGQGPIDIRAVKQA